jgi:DNA-binding IclR family transcriptional regulator
MRQTRPKTKPAQGAAGRSARIAPTAAKALRVIELLAADPPAARSLAEMQRRLGYSHGNLHAICTTLVAMGYLRREHGERTYRLGPALLTIGDAARVAYPSVEVALPFLRTLAAEFETEAHASMRSGDTIVVVARVGETSHDYGAAVGERFPLIPPLGSTFLAWADDTEQEHYLASAVGVLTPAEIDRCRSALASVARRGYSIHVDVEPSRKMRDTAARIVSEEEDDDDSELRALVLEMGRHDYMAADIEQIRAGSLVQVSAPAFDERGAVELSVGASLRAPVDGEAAVRAAGERVVATARMVTKAIGGDPPNC